MCYEDSTTLPALLGFPVATVVGLSNLTSGGPDKERRHFLEAAYLPMLAAAGCTHLLLNVFHCDVVRLARAWRMLLEPGVFAWGRTWLRSRAATRAIRLCVIPAEQTVSQFAKTDFYETVYPQGSCRNSVTLLCEPLKP